jgi:hypothetical protein
MNSQQDTDIGEKDQYEAQVATVGERQTKPLPDCLRDLSDPEIAAMEKKIVRKADFIIM